MHFGNSLRTAETERRMAAWRKVNPDATVSEYNRAYTTMWNSLTDFSDKKSDVATENPVVQEHTVASTDYHDMKERVRRRENKAPKHGRPVTRGAFGKKRR